MITFVIGEMGTGKNYVGQKLADYLGQPFYDGDDSLPGDLKRKVAKLQPLTVPNVNRFILSHLAPHLKNMSWGDKDIVVAQALYRQAHRDMLKGYLESREVRFVYVKPPSIFTHIKRLRGRNNGWSWVKNMLISKPFFQKPKDSIVINSNDNVDGQILAAFDPPSIVYPGGDKLQYETKFKIQI